MAASTAGALKAFLEAQSLNISVFRDRAPEGKLPPYIVVTEGIAVVPDKLEDGAASTGRETVQVTVWQAWKDTKTGALKESYTLAGDVVRALQGQPLNSAPRRAYAAVVRSAGPRLVEEEANLVSVPITAIVWREL